ncbi:MAG: TrkA family potassium uptake protein [Thermodesulfobacteriales bacterium]|jgi:voltage-gated potassium channel|nr:MAG: TrkA family potassium uptake protein [Thermodesulfobacteriales bacterium]
MPYRNQYHYPKIILVNPFKIVLIKRAGADRVVSPYYTGGVRIANSILIPSVVDFIEYATKTGNLELQLEEVQLSKGSKFNEMTLENIGIGRDPGIIIVAIKRLDGTMGFNPNSTSIVNVGDTLVALGETSKLKELEQLAAVS